MRQIKIVIRKDKETGLYSCGDSSTLALEKWEHVLLLGNWFRRRVRGSPCQAHLMAGLEVAKLLNTNDKLKIDKVDVIGMIVKQLEHNRIRTDAIIKYASYLKHHSVPGKIPKKYGV